jgi:two-component system response regulator YesN
MQSSIPASGPRAAAPLLRVLLVDDDYLLTRSLRRVLMALRPDLTIHVASSANEALDVLATSAFDAIITDLSMPGLSGLDWLERLQHDYPELPRLIHSSQVESFGEDEVRRLSHAAFAKPARASELLGALELAAWLSAPVQPGLRSA